MAQNGCPQQNFIGVLDEVKYDIEDVSNGETQFLSLRAALCVTMRARQMMHVLRAGELYRPHSVDGIKQFRPCRHFTARRCYVIRCRRHAPTAVYSAESGAAAGYAAL
eukprot:6210743-Pleurochrysis_carterae.AAC.2